MTYISFAVKNDVEQEEGQEQNATPQRKTKFLIQKINL